MTYSNFTMERLVEPEFEIFTLAEMKRLLRTYQNVTDQDDEITDLIKAGREWCEGFTGRALVEQTWRINFGEGVSVDTVREGWSGPCDWPSSARGVYLRRSPVQSITSFAAVGSDGEDVVIDADSYMLRDATSKWPRLVGLDSATWSPGTYSITFVAGFDEDMVPARFKQAIKLWCEAQFDRDEKMMPLLMMQAENMMRDERCHLSIT